MDLSFQVPQAVRDAIATAGRLGQAVGAQLPDFRTPNKDVAAAVRYNNPGAHYPGQVSRDYGSTRTGHIGGGHLIAEYPDALTGTAANLALWSRNYTGKNGEGRQLYNAVGEWSGNFARHDRAAQESYMRTLEDNGIPRNTVLTRELFKDPEFAYNFQRAQIQSEQGNKARPYLDAMTPGRFALAHALFMQKEFGDQGGVLSSPHVAPSPPEASPLGPTASGPMPQRYLDDIRRRYSGADADSDEGREFDKDIAAARRNVDRFVPADAPGGVRAALTGLTLDVGNSWQRKGLGQAIQSGDYDDAQKRFQQYYLSGGKKDPDMAANRQREAQWFNAPDDEPGMTGGGPDTGEGTDHQSVPTPPVPPGGIPMAALQGGWPQVMRLGGQGLAPQPPSQLEDMVKQLRDLGDDEQQQQSQTSQPQNGDQQPQAMPSFGKGLADYVQRARQSNTQGAITSDWTTNVKAHADQAEAEHARAQEALESPDSQDLSPDALKLQADQAQQKHENAQAFLQGVQGMEAQRLWDAAAPQPAPEPTPDEVAPGAYGAADIPPPLSVKTGPLSWLPTEAFGHAVSGTGEMLAGSGRLLESLPGRAAAGLEQQKTIWDRIDAGENVPLHDDPYRYQMQSPEGKAELRKVYASETSLPPEERTGATIGQYGKAFRETVGEPVAKTGKEFAVPPEVEQQYPILFGAAGGVGGAVPYLVLGALGTVTGGAGFGTFMGAAAAGAQSYESTYQAAVERGATEEQAHNAAGLSALVNAGLMSVPVSQWIGGLPQIFQGSMIREGAGLAMHGVTFAGTMQAMKALDNVVAKSTYDPNRSLTDGLGDAKGITSDLLAGFLLSVPGHIIHRGGEEATGQAPSQEAQPQAPPTEAETLQDQLALKQHHLAQLHTLAPTDETNGQIDQLQQEIDADKERLTTQQMAQRFAPEGGAQRPAEAEEQQPAAPQTLAERISRVRESEAQKTPQDHADDEWHGDHVLPEVNADLEDLHARLNAQLKREGEPPLDFGLTNDDIRQIAHIREARNLPTTEDALREWIAERGHTLVWPGEEQRTANAPADESEGVSRTPGGPGGAAGAELGGQGAEGAVGGRGVPAEPAVPGAPAIESGANQPNTGGARATGGPIATGVAERVGSGTSGANEPLRNAEQGVRAEGSATAEPRRGAGTDTAAAAAGGRGVTAFTTAKGSTYEVHDDGTTTRTKAARDEIGHEGDSGLKPRSQKTYYVDPKDAGRLAPPEAKWRIIDHGDNTLSLATQNPDGRWGISPDARNVPVTTTPEVGKQPFELWGRSERIGGFDAYNNFHPGNEITSVNEAPARTGRLGKGLADIKPKPPALAEGLRERLEEGGVKRTELPNEIMRLGGNIDQVGDVLDVGRREGWLREGSDGAIRKGEAFVPLADRTPEQRALAERRMQLLISSRGTGKFVSPKEWAKRIGVTNEDFRGTLVPWAESNGWIRHDPDTGVIRRIPERYQLADPGPEPELPSISPEDTITKRLDNREFETGKTLSERLGSDDSAARVNGWAQRIEEARGTTGFDSVFNDLKGAINQRGRPTEGTTLGQNEVRELANLVGSKATTKTSLADALKSIEARHNDLREFREEPARRIAKAIGAASKEAMEKLKRRETVDLEPHAQAVIDALSANRVNMMPEGIREGAVVKIEPMKKGKGHIVTTRDLDGVEHKFVAGFGLIDGTMALTHRIGGQPLVSFFTYDTSGDFAKRLGIERAHEAVHALRDYGPSKGLAFLEGTRDDLGSVWGRLLDHASNLGIMDIDLRQHYELLGDPRAVDIPVGASIYDVYHEFYGGDRALERKDKDPETLADYHEGMDQEAVAHMMELYVAKALPEQEFAPVKGILDAILSGEVANGTPESKWAGSRNNKPVASTAGAGQNRRLSPAEIQRLPHTRLSSGLKEVIEFEGQKWRPPRAEPITDAERAEGFHTANDIEVEAYGHTIRMRESDGRDEAGNPRTKTYDPENGAVVWESGHIGGSSIAQKQYAEAKAWRILHGLPDDTAEMGPWHPDFNLGTWRDQHPLPYVHPLNRGEDAAEARAEAKWAGKRATEEPLAATVGGEGEREPLRLVTQAEWKKRAQPRPGPYEHPKMLDVYNYPDPNQPLTREKAVAPLETYYVMRGNRQVGKAEVYVDPFDPTRTTMHVQSLWLADAKNGRMTLEDIKSLREAFRERHPEIKKFEGYRESGAKKELAGDKQFQSVVMAAAQRAQEAPENKRFTPEFANDYADLRTSLESQLRRMLPSDTAVRIFDRLSSGFEGDGRPFLGVSTPPMHPDNPFPGKWLIDLAYKEGDDFGNAIETAGHEIAHVLRRAGLWNDGEWKTLVERAKKIGMEGVIHEEGNLDFYREYYTKSLEDEGYTGKALDDALSELMDQEYVAKMVEHYIGGRKSFNAEKPVTYGKHIDALLDRIFKFFEAIRNGFRLRGFETADDVLERYFGPDVRLGASTEKGWGWDGLGGYPESMSPSAAIRAYHGTAADFDSFDITKVRTGEGNNMFGAGLYFAQAKSTGQHYQALFSKTGLLRRLFGKERIANLYQVDINTTPERMLDADKPLNEQPEAVQKFFRDVMLPMRWGKGEWLRNKQDKIDGRVLYQLLAHSLAGREPTFWEDMGQRGFDLRMAGMDAASRLLARNGIDGIQYYDQFSRKKQEGTRNFVVFRDDIVKITHKNGEPVSKTESDALVDAMKNTGITTPSRAFAREGQDQRREFDKLGFYSQALEAARGLKQEKGTPEQMLSQLKKAGVKDSEIKATRLDELFKSRMVQGSGESASPMEKVTPASERERPAIEAWHGSPHDLRNGVFDIAHALSGMGHQTYAYGHHFTSERSSGEAFARDGGHLYRVRLNVEPGRLLDFDKSLKQQSAHVRDALATIAPRLRNVSGDQVFDELRHGETKRTAKEAAEALRAAGIDGARYTVAGSPGDQYVIFPGNERLIQITEKDGQGIPQGRGDRTNAKASSKASLNQISKSEIISHLEKNKDSILREGMPMFAVRSATLRDSEVDRALTDVSDKLGILMPSEGGPKPKNGKTVDSQRYRLLTIANEGGEKLLSTLGNDLREVAAPHEAELAKYSDPGEDPSQEGFIDYFRDFISRPDEAKANAPNFTVEFGDFLDAHAPALLQAFETLQASSRARQAGRQAAAAGVRAKGPPPLPGAAAGGAGIGGNGFPPPPQTPGQGGATPPPGQPPVNLPRATPIADRLRQSWAGRAWIHTFDPALFSDAAFSAEPAFRAYKAGTAQEKDIAVKQSEANWWRFHNMGADENLDYMHRFEVGALQPTPELQADALRHRRILDTAYKLEKLYGSTAGFLEDYFPHIWKDPGRARQFFQSQAAGLGPRWFQKERTFDLIREGIAAGLELKTANAEELVTTRLLAGIDMRMRMELLRQLETMGMAVRVNPEQGDAMRLGTGGNGGPPLNDVAQAQLTRVGWKSIGAPNSEKWFIAPDIQPLWRNAIELKGLWGLENPIGSFFRGYMAFKNAWVPIKLALSGFHPLHVMHINLSNGLAVGLNHVLDGGNPIEAIKYAATGVDPIGAAVGGGLGYALGGPVGGAFGAYAGSMIGATKPWRGGPQLGKDAQDGWLVPHNQQTPTQRTNNALMRDGGFVPQMSEEQKQKGRKALADAWAQNEKLKVIPLAVSAAIQKLQHPIFEVWIPRLKAAAYLNEVTSLIQRYPELVDDPVQRGVAFAKIAKSIDNRFGEMFYGGLFWDPYLKHAGQAAFLSLGWNAGFIREFGGAAMQPTTAGAGVGMMLGGLPGAAVGGALGYAGGRLAQRYGYLGATRARQTARLASSKEQFAWTYMLTAAMGLGMMSWSLSGQQPEGWDFVFPRIGGNNPDGSPRRVTNMTYLREWPMLMKHIQDAGGVASGVADMLYNKMVIQPAVESWVNRDYWGREIYSDTNNWIQQGWDVLKQAFHGDFGKAKETLGETTPAKIASHLGQDQLNPITIAGARRAAEISGQPWQDWTNDPRNWAGAASQRAKSFLPEKLGGTEGVGLSALGFGPAPAYVERKGYENIINRYFNEYVRPSVAPEELGEASDQRRLLRQQLLIAHQKGDTAKEAAIRKQATDQKLGNIRTYEDPYSVYQFSQLKKFPRAQMDVLSHIPHDTPEEKATFRKYYDKASPSIKLQMQRP